MSGGSIYPTMMYEEKCLSTRQTDAGDAFGFDFRCLSWRCDAPNVDAERKLAANRHRVDAPARGKSDTIVAFSGTINNNVDSLNGDGRIARE